MKEIVVIAAVHSTISSSHGNLIDEEYYTSSPDTGYWQVAAANHCLATVGALVAEKTFLVRVLTTAPSDCFFVRKLKAIQPHILLCGFAVRNTENVAKAIDGASGVFLVTNVVYDRYESIEEEVAIGRSVANACVQCKIPHLVYCSQMHVYASVGLRCDSCDAKAHIADYMTNLGIPKTLVVAPFFYEDFLYGILKPVKTNQEKIYKIIVPTGHIPIDMIAMKDMGSCVKSIFSNSKLWIGKTVTLSGDKLTLKEYAQTITDEIAPNFTILDAQVTPDEFLQHNTWNGAEDMANFFDYLTRGVQRNNQVTTMKLVDSVLCFYDWTKLNKSKLNQMTM